MHLRILNPVALAAFCIPILSLTSCKSEKPPPETVEAVKKPSWFKQDKDGVLWFQQGDDEETKYSAALVLSAVTDGIVIVVTANEKHIDKAVNLALKMQKVLQKNEHTPDTVPVVAFKDQLVGVGYTFYTDGMRYGHDTIGKKGVFQPSEAKLVLSNVVKQHHFLKEYVAKGEWGGEDDKDLVVLKIVKATE